MIEVIDNFLSQEEFNFVLNYSKSALYAYGETDDETRPPLGLVHKIIKSKSYVSISRPKGTQNIIKKGDLIQILLLIQRIQKDGGKVNVEGFLKYYLESLNKARANKKLRYSYNGESTDFKATWRLGSDAGAIEWINNILFNIWY